MMSGQENSESSYKQARRALSQHLWHHHFNSYGSGTLEDRLEQHAELHVVGKRKLGVSLLHNHEAPEVGESAEEMALRLLREGEEQCDG